MTPKEKAKELFNRYKNPFDRNGCIPPTEMMYDSTAKQCVLIAVDEILKAPFENTYIDIIPEDQENTDWFWDHFRKYWSDVKTEIELL